MIYEGVTHRNVNIHSLRVCKQKMHLGAKSARSIYEHKQRTISYKKIVVVKDDIIPWRDEKGILYVGIREFLLDDRSLEL